MKRQYRDILREAEGRVVFIHLAPPHDVNLERMMARKGHYMKADMLASQIEILEDLQADEEGVRICNAGSAEDVQADIIGRIKSMNL